MTKKEMAAKVREIGYTAYFEGVRYDDCPFSKPTKIAQWKRGWLRAEEVDTMRVKVTELQNHFARVA